MNKDKHGFSLLEILAAMAIAALAMVIAGPPVASTLDKVSFRREVNSVMAQVRGWKLLAVSKGKALTIHIEDDAVVMQLGQQEEVRTPIKEGMTLALAPERLQFSPEGWATPATIEIQSKERHRRLRIDALTGQPRKI